MASQHTVLDDPLAWRMEFPMLKLNAPFLREEDSVLVGGDKWSNSSFDELVFEGLLRIANASPEFVDFCRQHRPIPGRSPNQTWLNVSTVKRRLSDDWVEAFRFWSGLPLQLFLPAAVLQGTLMKHNKPTSLLINGTSNGCVLKENPDWAAVVRWHDPERSYEFQTATWPNPGWSFGIVSTLSRAWCHPGMRIMYL